jgi:uncharacterized membrane protein
VFNRIPKSINARNFLKKYKDWKDGLSLEKITRIVLIFGIITILGAIVYTSNRPEEKDHLFFILNENQDLKDYPTSCLVGENISLFTYIENHLGETNEFKVKVFRCIENTTMQSDIDLQNNSNATYLQSQTFKLDNKQSIISDSFNVSFVESGRKQILIFELWIFTNSIWQFVPDYSLNLKIDVI